jgi:hypothetical protein
MKKWALLSVTVLFASCFGMSSDITIAKDGSGTAQLVYRISEDLLALGTLDGNENFPSIPVGEEDFKRTIERIDGLTLTSFSSKKEDINRVYTVKFNFLTIDALIKFLDTQGQHCVLTEKDGTHILSMVFAPGTEEYTPEMLELMPVIFDGYNFDFTLKVPKTLKVEFFNQNAVKIPAPPVGLATTGERTIHFSAPMGALFAANEAVALEIFW